MNKFVLAGIFVLGACAMKINQHVPDVPETNGKRETSVDANRIPSLSNMGAPNVDPTSAAAAADQRQANRVAAKEAKVAAKLAAKAKAEAERVERMNKQKHDKTLTLPEKKALAKGISDKRNADNNAANAASDAAGQKARKDSQAAALASKQANRDSTRNSVYDKNRADWQGERTQTNTGRQNAKANALAGKQAVRDQMRLDAIQSNVDSKAKQKADAQGASWDTMMDRQDNRNAELQAKKDKKAADNSVARKSVHDASVADQVVQYAANKAKQDKKKADYKAAKQEEHSGNHAADRSAHGVRATASKAEDDKIKADHLQEDIDASKARADSKVAIGHAKAVGSRRRGHTSSDGAGDGA